MNKKKKVILILLGIIGLLAITVGVTYAFFNYVKEGATENTVTTGTITFLYTEVEANGAGISIENALPMEDSQGKIQTGSGKVFDFTVKANTKTKAAINYEVTARKKETSTLDESAVKIYLTEVTGDTEQELLLDKYSNLEKTSVTVPIGTVEKTIYTGKVTSNTENYQKDFRLRMWMDEDIDFSPVKDESGNDIYPYNNKEFTVTVNVYANAKVVTEEEIINESKAEILTLTVDGTELTAVENEDYDYEIKLPEGTTKTTINVETNSPNATVEIEKIDSLAYSSNIKRLSTQKTLNLTEGDNYFKITVTSENKKVENEYKIRIRVQEVITLFGENISVILDSPTLTTSSNNTTDESGLYKSTATNSSDPTYYFRGNVENNYIDFAGFTWRIVRINEDGTIRIVMQDGINDNTPYSYNLNNTNKQSMYYSNSKTDGAKYHLDLWYQDNILKKGYSDDVSTGDYYCEEAKTSIDSATGIDSGANMTVFSNYSPDFKCKEDANGYGIVNSNIGLLTYDEIVYAGGHRNNKNTNFYLYSNSINSWLMSTAGYHTNSVIWTYNEYISFASTEFSYHLRPVINLKSNITVTGTGVSDDHWVVQ